MDAETVSRMPFSPRLSTVSVIIVNYNTRDLLLACLERVANQVALPRPEVIVVDNGSTDGSPEGVESRCPGVEVVRLKENLGYGRACNVGMSAAKGDFFLLLNTDIELREDTVSALLNGVGDDPRIGIAGCRLEGPNGERQTSHHASFPHSGERIAGDCGNGGIACAWVSGAALFVRRECWAQTGGFDESIFLYAEETDWCYRALQMGWKVAWLPGIVVVHLSGRTATALPGHEVDFHLSLGQMAFFFKHYPDEWVRRYRRKRMRREARGTLTHLALSHLPGRIGRKHRGKYLAYACRLWYWLGQKEGRGKQRLWALLDAEARSSAEAAAKHWLHNELLFPRTEKQH